MIDYINKVGQTIPQTLKLAQTHEVIKDTYTLQLYGYYEEVGFKRFFKKIKQGVKVYLKTKHNGRRN